MSFAATRNATSSPAPASGPTPSEAAASPTIDRPAAALALVSPSAPPEMGSVSPIPGTSGPTGALLSPAVVQRASLGLASSLVSRLQRRARGSILYRLTWKLSATPSGRLTYRLRASAASISASDFTGWPTPTTPSGGQTWPPGTTATGRRPDGSKATVNLEQVAMLAGWATPAAQEAGGTPEQFLARKRAAVEKGASLGISLTSLSLQATLAAWRSPNTVDAKGGDRLAPGSQVQLCHQVKSIGYLAGMENGGRLRAGHSRWLMRIPSAWDDCASTAMRSTRKRR